MTRTGSRNVANVPITLVQVEFPIERCEESETRTTKNMALQPGTAFPMEIPTYQIHAVLSSLSRRLNCRSDVDGAGGGKNTEDHRLQGVIERVSRRIVERITEAGLRQERTGAWEHLQSSRPRGEEPLLFRYSVLDRNGRRQRRSIPIEAASLLPETRIDSKNRDSNDGP